MIAVPFSVPLSCLIVEELLHNYYTLNQLLLCRSFQIPVDLQHAVLQCSPKRLCAVSAGWSVSGLGRVWHRTQRILGRWCHFLIWLKVADLFGSVFFFTSKAFLRRTGAWCPGSPTRHGIRKDTFQDCLCCLRSFDRRRPIRKWIWGTSLTSLSHLHQLVFGWCGWKTCWSRHNMGIQPCQTSPLPRKWLAKELWPQLQP